MKTISFMCELQSDGSLRIPPAAVSELSGRGPLRIFVLAPESSEEEEEDWAGFSLKQFFSRDPEDDLLYDEIPVR